MKKNVRQGNKQMVFLSLVPCIVFLACIGIECILQFSLGIGVFFKTANNLGLSSGTAQGIKVAVNIVNVVLLLWLFVSSYVMVVNTTGFKNVGKPSVPTLNITIGSDYIKASTSRTYSSAQKAKIIFNVIISIFFGVVTALLGWLLFILYKKDRFMYKVKRMSVEMDEAEELIARKSSDIEQLALYFYRMLEYADVYNNLGEKKGKKEMLDLAKKLLDLWEIAENSKN